MSKTLLSAALVAVMATVAFAPTAQAADGTITIKGKVVANTCVFKINGGNASDTVQLPVVFTSALATAGTVAGTTPFTLSVSGCDTNLTSVQETFGGSNIQADGKLKNTAATNNVEVQLLTGTGSTPGTAIDLFNNPNTAAATLAAGAATFNLQAQYYATGAATSGLVSTTVTYTTQYQ